MGKRVKGKVAESPPYNQRRTRPTFAEAMRLANRRAHEKANRRGERRQLQSMRAVMEAARYEEEGFGLEWLARTLRVVLGLMLLPWCWVTMWTLLERFSDATRQGFWHAPAFWYFAVGCLLMIGWFASRLLHAFFIYLYVLGHELTHVLFVLIFRGRVSDFHVSTQGGYITTNKTNLLIALSPYFVPFWAVVGAAIYAAAKPGFGLTTKWDLAFYAVMGVTWTFHMVWTLWMIPRDQPDLRENGTLLSLVVIFLANLLVLVLLLCVAGDSPLRNLQEFGREWLRNVATWMDVVWRWALRAVVDVRAAAKL